MKTKNIVKQINLFRFQIEEFDVSDKYLKIFIKENIKTTNKLVKVINKSKLNKVDYDNLIISFIVNNIIEDLDFVFNLYGEL